MYFRRDLINSRDSIDQMSWALKNLMVFNNQNRPAEKQIEGDITTLGVQTVLAQKQGESRIAENGGLRDLAERQTNNLLPRVGNGIHGGIEITRPEN